VCTAMEKIIMYMPDIEGLVELGQSIDGVKLQHYHVAR
jgi:hypothetical protein